MTSAPGGNRTPDLDVRTVLLYPLSYEGVDSQSVLAMAPYSIPRRRHFSANSHSAHRRRPAARANVRTMENDRTAENGIRARDAATRTLNRITAGVAFVAIASITLLGVVSAHTIPGIAASATGATSSVSPSSGSTSSSSTSSASSSTGLQSSSTPVSSSSSSGHAVSGGS
jgi:hypothetical protein